MSFQLQTSLPSTTAAKRARSADSSGAATPIPSEGAAAATDATATTAEHPEIRLPPFLRQSKSDLLNKFNHLTLHQQNRLEHPYISGDGDSPWTVDNSFQSRLRNRYVDVKPWSKSRIRLKVPEGASDYINASPIKLMCSVTGAERNYIAAQGPKETGVNDFWQMVWHETSSVAVIIMLTQLIEGVREKCFRYYPEDHESEGIELSFRDDHDELHSGSVVADSPTVFDDATRSAIRRLKLSYNGESKTVFHLFFLAWPDHGVPEAADRASLLELLTLSREKNDGWNNPRIVHCSAGVGRSGSFIALEHLLAELEMGAMDKYMDERREDEKQKDKGKADQETGDGEEVDEEVEEDPVFETVNLLREQRMTMVQSNEQFEFLYGTLAEAYTQRYVSRKAAGLIPGLGAGTSKDSAADNDEALLPQQVELSGKNKPNGEPSPKAMRLSRGLRRVLADMRERSSSLHRRLQQQQSTDDATATPETEEKQEEEKLMASPPEGNWLYGISSSRAPLIAAMVFAAVAASLFMYKR